MKTKKLVITFLLIFFIFFEFFYNISFASNAEISVDSETAILIDAATGKVLFEKNADKKMYPASTTKILTAIIALENCDLTEVATASYEAVMTVPVGYSNAAIQVGEELTVEQLLEVLLIHSANEAGNVLAEHIGGSIKSFATIMNTKAEEIGCTSSHFTNPSGIHDEEHYSTAKDMALIAKYCMKNANFRALVSKTSCTIAPTNKYEERNFKTTNNLLLPKNRYYYQNAIGIKTGFTTQAKNCLISASNKDGFEVICVILGAEQTADKLSARYVDTIKLFNYAYENYTINKIKTTGDIITQVQIPHASKDTKSLDLTLENDISVLLDKETSTSNLNPEITINENLSAPIAQNTVIGKIKYNVDGIEYSSNLLASHNVEKSDFIIQIFRIILILLIFLILFKLLFHKKRYKKKKKLKRKKYAKHKI